MQLMESERLAAAEAAALRWRRVAGTLSCHHTGVGPTGGFCPRSMTTGGDAGCLPKKLASRLGLLFANSSVLDYGCGMGRYGHFFTAHAPTVRWTGVDGAEGVEETTKGHVRFAELTDPLPSAIRRLGPAPWDYVLSIEVAEHIARRDEPTFLHSLASSARAGIVVSWARLGQGGTAHINCQASDYVVCAMALLGWERDESTERWLASSVGRHLHDCGWLRTTLLAFRPRPRREAALCGAAEAAGTAAGSLFPCALPVTPSRTFAAAYLRATRTRCPYVRDGCNSTTYPYSLESVLAPKSSHLLEDLEG